MRLVMKCKDTTANIRVDKVERVGDVIYAYRIQNFTDPSLMPKTEFAGMFDLGAMDFLYVSEEKV